MEAPHASISNKASPSTIKDVALYVLKHRRQITPNGPRDAALRSIYDLAGCVMVGLNQNGPRAIRDTLPGIAPPGNVPIWFTTQTSSVIGAAWANASAAAAMDLDDGHRLARGHPGAAVIPAVFAMAHGSAVSDEDMITAITIGYEVGIAIADARTSYGGSGTWATAAVVAAAAALRNTSQQQLEHALAFALEEAPNQSFQSSPSPRIPAPEGCDIKEGIPWAVHTGLTGLFLAESGHTGPRNILQSVRLYRPFCKPLSFDGSSHICNTYIKLYTSCRHTHPPVDALRQLLSRDQIDARRIDAIKVEIYNGALRITNKPVPENTIDVQFSIPYTLALVALVGPQALLPVTEDALKHEGVAELAQKVALSLHGEFDKRFPAETVCQVEVRCGDTVYTSDIVAPKGEASSPLGYDELEEKLNIASRLVASETVRRDVISALSVTKTGNLTDFRSCFQSIVL